MTTKNYNELSKAFYIKTYTEYVAYHLYLDQKYYKKHYNPQITLNTCLNAGWVLTDQEKKTMLNQAKVIAENKYKISI